jgi:hypothetical protein
MYSKVCTFLFTLGLADPHSYVSDLDLALSEYLDPDPDSVAQSCPFLQIICKIVSNLLNYFFTISIFWIVLCPVSVIMGEMKKNPTKSTISKFFY